MWALGWFVSHCFPGVSRVGERLTVALSLPLAQCVVLVDAPMDQQLRVDEFCRAQEPAIKVCPRIRVSARY